MEFIVDDKWYSLPVMDDYVGKVKVLVAGDQGMVIDFDSEISVEINILVQRFVTSLAEWAKDGIIEVVPIYQQLKILNL
ncbi:MAG: Carboxyltransferase domain, subdomain [Firmicutes bacterium]|nr:Carboxyltransferase domain, subdomain [Bacillota bacterium]